MNLKPLRYTFVFSALAFGIVSLLAHGIWTFALPLYAFLFVPLLEQIIPATGTNLTEEEEEQEAKNPMYDYVLYIMVPVLYGFLILGIFSLQEPGLTTLELVGRIFSIGLALVAAGINIGHELGHRSTWHEQFMSKALYLPSLQIHFFIEHNRGHHKHVSTEDDPASARYGELLYTFWFRSWIGGYISAWKLENERLRKKGIRAFSIYNEMIWYEIIQVLYVLTIGIFAGWKIALFLVIAGMISKLLLETINYIEHYGLARKKTKDGFERVLPVHSWNSNHWVGRVLLFELTRHSDHHYKASRKYQILKHYEDVPQMPGGYPAMILLSFIPPLWFYVMHRQIEKFKRESAGGMALA